ncbi:hypothetical protein Pmani_017539 [Petrolisthes manimaculis]|uniref:Integrase p58-like C-terminal domain-containing protein n=1 Tax=Petrolisthes manimaculis TaxID=1843537 RepID=A0AAE1PM65_9EUCA|nr:hypothetical protein Pmani_017539 [Petrolisthes manimaculis]
MFNLEEFVDNPSVGALTTLQKKEWISLATAYQLEPRPNLTKTQLQRYVPRFDEGQPETFFSQFEKNAAIHRWPQGTWAVLLSNVFTGEAQRAYAGLSVNESLDYPTVKSTILRVYKRVPAYYRKIFQTSQKRANQTCVEFYREKLAQCQRWVDSAQVEDNYRKLLELIVYEEVKSCMPDQLQSYLEGLGIHDLEAAGPASDHYLLTYPHVNFRNKLPLAQSSHKVNPYPSGPREPAALSPLQGRPRFAPVSSAGEIPVEGYEKIKSQDALEMHPSYKPYCFLGSVSPDDSLQLSHPVTILRDSGSVRTFVLREAISSFPQCQTGHSLVVRGLFSKGEVPLCKIFLQSAVMTGYVSAGIVNELPVAGVSMILGNDVAGSSMFPHSPSVSPNCASPEQEPSEVSPACVVTRSHSRRLVKDSFSVPQVANPPPENIVSDSPTPEFALDEFFNNASQESNVPDQTSSSEPVIRSIADMAVTRTTLIAEQAKDPNLKKCFDHASKFCGPYKVLKKESSVNYLISTPDRRKKTRLVHINLLKEYKSRDVAVTELTAESQCLVVTSSPDVEESDITRCSHLVEPNDHEEERANAVVEPVLHNSQVLKNPGENLTHLQEEQAASIVHLLQEHVALFSDSPSLCPLLRHDVDVQDSHPVRQPPYRLNAEKR